MPSHPAGILSHFTWSEIPRAAHTHGGQVALPFAHHLNLSRMISDRTRGIFRNGVGTLYVSRGLGMAGLPLRINCPREIALIRLVAEPS